MSNSRIAFREGVAELFEFLEVLVNCTSIFFYMLLKISYGSQVIEIDQVSESLP